VESEEGVKANGLFTAMADKNMINCSRLVNCSNSLFFHSFHICLSALLFMYIKLKKNTPTHTRAMSWQERESENTENVWYAYANAKGEKKRTSDREREIAW